MTSKLVNIFAGVALASAGMLTKTAADTSPPVAIANPVCPAPTVIVTDENDRPWIAVDAVTRDGVAVQFQLNLSYRPGGGGDITTLHQCTGLTPHIMGLAKIAYAREILHVDYTALPGEAAAIMRRAALATEQDIRAVMGPATPAITGMGIRAVTAPGMPAPYAQAMMTGHLQLPPYNAPRFVVATHDGTAAEYAVTYTFAVTPQGYEHFGPVTGAIRSAIDDTVLRALGAAAGTREQSCLDADRDYITAQAYADSAARLRADYPGLALLSLDIGVATFPADIAAPAVGPDQKPICIKGITP